MNVFWLALAAFALSTEAFVVAGILPLISADLQVSVATAGQLVTAYSLTYAIGAPILAVAFHNVDRKTTLILALSLFILGNLGAAVAPSFGVLMACRIVMSLGTALCNPTALGVAVAISPPERRGRAVAAVMSGVTVATVLGMPLGTLIGNQITWRAPFIMIAVFAGAALAGILLRMPRRLPVSVATMTERLAVARQKDVLFALVTTTLWATGGFTVFTYIAVPLRANGFGSAEISLILFVYGSACAIGNILGGRLADRMGTGSTSVIGLIGMMMALTLLSATLKYTGFDHGRYLVVLPIIAWGLFSWCFLPGQVASISRSVPQVAGIALSLNSSFMNLGFALGGALGGIVLSALGPADLGWVGGLCVAAALLTLILRERRERLRSVPIPS